MVYLDISVEDIDESVSYYCQKLGIFEHTAGRLVCRYGVNLIVDLYEVGTDSHIGKFGESKHVRSSFWIHIGSDDYDAEIELKPQIDSMNVSYEEIINLGGHYLHFRDPSGNKFSIHAHNGVLK